MALAPSELASKNRTHIRGVTFHLQKDVIRQINKEEQTFTPNLWNARGKRIEARGKTVIEKAEVVSKVDLNANPSEAGYDAVIHFIDGFVINSAKAEFKSDNKGVQDYKQKVRNRLPEGKRNMEGVRENMTENKVILMNTTEKKPDEVIIYDSFYPQLKRILAKRFIDSVAEVKAKRT